MAPVPQTDLVKQKILDLTFYAFNEKGYKAVSMDLVARELRISKKTIYKHFHSKEEILETAMRGLFSDIEQKVGQVVQESDPGQVFFEFFLLQQRFLRNFSTALRSEIQFRIPHLEDRIRAFEKQVLYQNFAAWLKSQRKAGVVDYPSPTREVAGTIMELMRGISDSPEEKVRFLLMALLKGMASGKKKKRK